MKCDLYKPDDTDEEEISLGTKPGVPAKYESICIHEAQLQTAESSLQIALNKVAKLEAAIIDTQKRCHKAEEKARTKSQDLKIAKVAIIDNNAEINDLERRNSELNTSLDTIKEALDKKHEELFDWKVRYKIDCEEAMKIYHTHRQLGVDLFFRMTYLEALLAHECRRFFWGENDRIIKARAATYLQLDEASVTTQEGLHKAFMELNANYDFPEEKKAAYGTFGLAIQAPPKMDKTAEFSSFSASGMEQFTHSATQETRVVEDCGSLGPTTPEKSTLKSNNRSDSEASPRSPNTQSNSEEGRPDSATSNETELESSMCEDSGADSDYRPKVEGHSATEGRGLGLLLGYNPNPEESFYPQYLQEASKVESSPEQVTHAILSEGSPETEGPSLQWLLGYNPEPEELFYPQYSQQDEHQGNSTSPASIEQAQEHTDATLPDSAPTFEAKPEDHTTPSTLASPTPLAIDVSFADTSKDFKEEVIVQIEPEETASTASTELEQKKTTSKTPEATPIFTPQAEDPLPASPTSPVDISFGNTSQPFVAGTKARLTRAQRREAAIKAQAETIASKNKKVDARNEEEEGGKFGKKESRQERRANERKAKKEKAGKQVKRNVLRL